MCWFLKVPVKLKVIQFICIQTRTALSLEWMKSSKSIAKFNETVQYVEMTPEEEEFCQRRVDHFVSADSIPTDPIESQWKEKNSNSFQSSKCNKGPQPRKTTKVTSFRNNVNKSFRTQKLQFPLEQAEADADEFADWSPLDVDHFHFSIAL